MVTSTGHCPTSNIFFVKANILINQNGHACLADFGLLTILSDPTSFTASNSLIIGGTTRWMSPELLDPDQVNPEDGRPTKESDCYALGMVTYEVLSGQAPFERFREVIVIQKVIKGERPGRPEGVKGIWFTDDIWSMLNLCWAPQPKSRPSIEAILECLEQVSGAWEPPSLQVEEGVEMNQDDWDFITVSDSSGIIPCFNFFHSTLSWRILC